MNSRISEHFGRAPYFLTIDLDESDNITRHDIVVNDSEHFGGVGLPPDRILQLQPNALITGGMGPKALNIFQNARVAVFRANTTNVIDTVAAYTNNELRELTEGCKDAHHH